MPTIAPPIALTERYARKVYETTRMQAEQQGKILVMWENLPEPERIRRLARARDDLACLFQDQESVILGMARDVVEMAMLRLPSSGGTTSTRRAAADQGTTVRPG